MNTAEFRNTVSRHRCRAFRTLMQPGSRGSTTVTFFYDVNGTSKFVWLSATTADGQPLLLPGFVFALERDWHISLFTENARRVWGELVSAGWREIATGVIG